MNTEGLAKANLLWDEYKYRHQHCWKVVFQITIALVVISVIPYTQKEVVRVLQRGIMALPVLALGLVLFSIVIMWRELALLSKVKIAYRHLQGQMNIVTHPSRPSWFSFFVLSYMTGLFIAGWFNLYFLWVKWIPYVLCSP